MTPEVLTNEQLKALTVEACILKGELLNAPGDYKKSLESLIGIIGDITNRLSAETQRRQEGAEACEWSPQNDWEDDNDDRWWNTGCGHEFVLNAGNVPGREFSYCPCCGGEASPPAVSVGEQEKERE